MSSRPISAVSGGWSPGRRAASVAQSPKAPSATVPASRLSRGMPRSSSRWRRRAADRDAAPIDVLVNNVGVLLNEHQLSAEGHELSFATNLLNHYVLTTGLIERGLLAQDALIISMSSGGMYNVPLRIASLNELDAAGFRALFKHVLRDADEGADTALWLAATRPWQRRDEAIWFDRAERDTHLSDDTRRGADSAEDLADYLEGLSRRPQQ